MGDESTVVTGEEEDETVHSVKCKLYAMNNEAWVERGSGLLKLNLFRNNDRHDARLSMYTSYFCNQGVYVSYR